MPARPDDSYTHEAACERTDPVSDRVVSLPGTGASSRGRHDRGCWRYPGVEECRGPARMDDDDSGDDR